MSSAAVSTSLTAPAAAVPAVLKTPRIIRYSQVAQQPLQWLWPGRIALGKLTFLVGEPGLGKGLLAIDLAARVSRGSPWPGEPQHNAPLGTAMVLLAEDDPQDTVPARLIAAGADLDRIITFEMETASEHSQIPRSFSLGDDLGTLEAALAATPDCRLVVIDPISAYLGRTDGNHNGEVRSLLQPLAELARIHRVAIVAVAHLNKRSSASSVNRVMGALSFVSTARTVWGIVRDPQDPNQRLMLSIKNNLAEDNQGLRFRLPPSGSVPVPCVEWNAEPVTMSFQMACGGRFNRAQQEYSDTENHITVRLQEELTAGPQSRQYLNLVVPGSEEQQYRAADRLGIIKVKEGYVGGWLWMLPEHFPNWQAEREKQRQMQTQKRIARKRKQEHKTRRAKRQTKKRGEQKLRATGSASARPIGKGDRSHSNASTPADGISEPLRQFLQATAPSVPVDQAAEMLRQKLERTVKDGMGSRSVT